MFRLFLILAISVFSYARDVALIDLAFLVSKKDGVSVIFAQDVSKTIIVDFPSDYKGKTYLPVFRSILKANGLDLKNDGGIYIVSTVKDSLVDVPVASGVFESSSLSSAPVLSNKPVSITAYTSPRVSQDSVPAQAFAPAPSSDPISSDFNVSFRTYKLDFLKIDDVKPLLDFSALPYSFSPVTKTITFKQDSKNSEYLCKLLDELESIDRVKNQVTLRITMFNTNQSKLRDVGFNPSLKADFSLMSKDGALFEGDGVLEFKASLNMLSQKGVTDVVSNTSYLIADNEKLDFKKVVSIPVLDENFALTTDNGTNQTKKYRYKDVGFTVVAIPTIVGDTVYLDFSLTVGDVLSSGDLPTTTENTITNKFSVKKGSLILLAGLSKNEKNNQDDSIPFIEDIPFLKDIFTHSSKSVIDETFNISIEILE